MFTDTRIIQRHAAYEVLAHHVAITWPDQSTVNLHAVRVHGYDDTFLRALRCDVIHWIVFDLRDVAPTLAADIKALPRRDTDGLVLHTLRLAYDDATEFCHRAEGRFRAGWLVSREPAPRQALGVAA